MKCRNIYVYENAFIWEKYEISSPQKYVIP